MNRNPSFSGNTRTGTQASVVWFIFIFIFASWTVKKEEKDRSNIEVVKQKNSAPFPHHLNERFKEYIALGW